MVKLIIHYGFSAEESKWKGLPSDCPAGSVIDWEFAGQREDSHPVQVVAGRCQISSCCSELHSIKT